MTRLSLQFLGDFQARLGPGPPLRLRTRQTQALLAYLALPPGQPHSRDKLAAMLWAERSPQQARERLRQSLFVLRRTLAAADPPCLALDGETIALHAEAVDVDVAAFERLVQASGPDALAEAGRLYRGDFLEGLGFRGPLFEDWLMAERERLRELAVDALAKLLAHQRTAGSAEATVPTALRLLALDPLQEVVHRTLMRLYAQLGRRGAALRQYQLCLGVLRRQLGVEPEVETRQLYQDILRRRPGAFRGSDSAMAQGFRASTVLGLPAGLGTPASPLIGRDHEMTRLRALLAQAHDGQGQLVVLVGEAGIGKTRLVAEIATEALRCGARLLVGRCYESDQILPFGPWVDALRTSGVTADGALLDELAPTWRAELTRLLPEVNTASLPPPADDRLRLFESVSRLVERLAARQPLFLLFEDVHLADEMSMRLLAFVARRIDGRPLMVVATAREEELADASIVRQTLEVLGAQFRAGRLRLVPLSRPDTGRLVHALARIGTDAPQRTRLEERVWAVSEGNPFVAVETMRALDEGGVLDDSATLPLPQRVRELIVGRLERLGDGARQLAAAAAVIGREFDYALLHRTADLDDGATAKGVEELVRRHVLHEIGERLDFTHDRIRAVAYDRQLAGHRRALHRKSAEAMEALYAADLEPHYLALALHYRESGVWDRAVDFFRRAGETAAARSAGREALASFERALETLGHLPETLESARQAIDIRLNLQGVQVLVGDMEGALRNLHEAQRRAEELDDQSRLGWTLAHLTVCVWWTAQLEQGREIGERTVAIARGLGDRPMDVVARTRLGRIYLDLGDCRRALELLRHNADTMRDPVLVRERFDMASLPSVTTLVYMSHCLAVMGTFGEAAVVGREAVELATSIGHPYSMALACYHAGRLHLLQGELPDALVWLDRSLEASRQAGYYLSSTTSSLKGQVYIWLGRVDEGVSLLAEAVEQLGAMRNLVQHAPSLARLAEGYGRAGRSDEAFTRAREARALISACKMRGEEAEALRILGGIKASAEPPDVAAAENFYRAAVDLADQLDMRPLAARCHLGLGQLYRHSGEVRRARAHLCTARSLLREMNMRFWLEHADAELTMTPPEPGIGTAPVP